MITLFPGLIKGLFIFVYKDLPSVSSWLVQIFALGGSMHLFMCIMSDIAYTFKYLQVNSIFARVLPYILYDPLFSDLFGTTLYYMIVTTSLLVPINLLCTLHS